MVGKAGSYTRGPELRGGPPGLPDKGHVTHGDTPPAPADGAAVVEDQGQADRRGSSARCGARKLPVRQTHGSPSCTDVSPSSCARHIHPAIRVGPCCQGYTKSETPHVRFPGVPSTGAAH
ncbi:unnamed protein product [Pleuronectes platessa]|uniref:Uncharacterized protein n=1 Tax=Pleuronectes platessa TaxID=8262 RepID=A0A9N7YXM9_PLEPL|nr:unnamed protein product [Pleuronectes platessa]